MTELHSRRTVLRTMVACACCLSAARKLSAADMEKPHWGYDGEAGPEHWGELSADFKTCEIGTKQTPIDLTGTIKAETGKPLAIDYHAVAGRVLNNGHTVQVNVAKGCGCVIDGERFDLLQFHFHHPSEHLLSGQAQEMEAHFVHKSAGSKLAVIGVFVRKGARNAALEPVFSKMPAAAGPEEALAEAFDPSRLFPEAAGNADRPFYRYMGSLTTPPCTEGLVWTVFKDPIEASEDQIKQFSALFPNNARPVMQLNRRKLMLFEG